MDRFHRIPYYPIIFQRTDQLLDILLSLRVFDIQTVIIWVVYLLGYWFNAAVQSLSPQVNSGQLHRSGGLRAHIQL